MNTKKHDVPEELLSGLLASYKKPEDLIGENGLLKQLTKLLVERALDAELTEHLGHERNEAVANPAGNTRNGKSRKTLKGDFGELPIETGTAPYQLWLVKTGRLQTPATAAMQRGDIRLPCARQKGASARQRSANRAKFLSTVAKAGNLE